MKSDGPRRFPSFPFLSVGSGDLTVGMGLDLTTGGYSVFLKIFEAEIRGVKLL